MQEQRRASHEYNVLQSYVLAAIPEKPQQSTLVNRLQNSKKCIFSKHRPENSGVKHIGLESKGCDSVTNYYWYYTAWVAVKVNYKYFIIKMSQYFLMRISVFVICI